MGLDVGEKLKAEVLLAAVEGGYLWVGSEGGAANAAALEETQHPLTAEGIGHDAL